MTVDGALVLLYMLDRPGLKRPRRREQQIRWEATPLSATHEIDYEGLTFRYVRAPDLDSGTSTHRRVIVVGAGPVGLATAIDLAQHGIGSCCSTTTTGCRRLPRHLLRQADAGDLRPPRLRRPMVGKGRRLEHRPGLPARQADLQLRPARRGRPHRPAFINLQQYYVEGYLFERARSCPNLEIRWKNRVAAVDAGRGGVTLHGRDARRRLRAALRLPRRGRRRAQPDPQGARP